MIPLGDDKRTRSFPFVTIALIIGNVAVFLSELAHPGDETVLHWALVPAELVHVPSLWACTTVFTSMFLHGGWLHLLGNMFYLWSFGNNIEDAVGHIRFLVFYLLCGGVAAAAQVAFAPDSMVPMIGASGAVSGVLGAYLLLFPRARSGARADFYFSQNVRGARRVAAGVLVRVASAQRIGDDRDGG